MKRSLPVSVLAVVLSHTVWSSTAEALIKVDFPVSRIYGESKAVIVGKILGTNAASRVVDVGVAETLKGKSPGERMRIQMTTPEAVFDTVSPGQPVVVFVGESPNEPMAVVHIADTWLLAQGIANPAQSLWRTVQFYKAVNFPGRTAALARVLQELKAGDSTIQDFMETDVLLGGVRLLANLKLKPTSLVACDVNGDKKPDLIVGTSNGVRLFLATSAGYADATEPWGLAGATGTRIAVGDVDGDSQSDLLLGAALWARRGDKFVPAKTFSDLPPESEWLAVAVSDVTGDNRADVVILQKTGKLVTLQNPGTLDGSWLAASRSLWDGGQVPGAAAFSSDWGDTGELHLLVVRENDIVRYAVGPKGGPTADFSRLTGVALSACGGLAGKPLNVVASTPIDCDGCGRNDFLVVTQAGALILVNRGFGSFLVDSTVLKRFHPDKDQPLPFALTPDTAVAPLRKADGDHARQNLLILTEDGRLFEMENTPKK